MKRKNLLFMAGMLMVIMTMFTGCLIDGVERHYLYLKVSPYETGDKCGLYILNNHGVVVKTNEQVTISEDGEAIFRDYDVKFYDAGNTYFLYFPYAKGLNEFMPAMGDTIDTKNPMEFFGGLKGMGEVRVSRGQPSTCGEFIEVFEMIPLN